MLQVVLPGRPDVSIGTFLRRADSAVQDTKTSVTTGVLLAVIAIVTAVVAVLIAVVKR
jgi:hypothetical protein